MISKNKSFQKIWSIENTPTDFFFPGALKERSATIVSLIQLVAAIWSLIYFSLPLAIVLFLTQLYFTVRFRGTFNGGSDMITFVVLTGLLISFAHLKFGLVYIAIHGIYSYLKAGYVKIIQKDWRSGLAINEFLKRSQITTTKKIRFSKSPSLLICWGTILFELSIIGLFAFPKFVFVYFGFAVVFHLGVYFMFGLNRFFWAWMCAWPAILVMIHP